MKALRLASLFCLLCLLCPPASARAREAGWAPIEKPADIARKHGLKKTKGAPAKNAVARKAVPAEEKTVYDNQPPVTEGEINAFVAILPSFRAWARKNGETAHPMLSESGKPDFLYSGAAARWVREHKFEPSRFFCIMGRMAAAMVIVEEGNDFKGTRPVDMPPVAQEELGLVRKHMGSLRRAGGPAQPIK
ncbi:MAG: serine/threonine protein phosphatase [Desulfovibrio sp.]|nr:serine/threonine protein phosphatase [Desulfovibrio sp.]